MNKVINVKINYLMFICSFKKILKYALLVKANLLLSIEQSCYYLFWCSYLFRSFSTISGL